MAFYAQAQQMSTGNIVALCRRQTTVVNEREWGWADEGTFKPLSEWEKQGKPIDEIKAKARPEDIRKHPDYDWEEYRVRELKTSSKSATKVVDKLELLAKTRTRALKRNLSQESARSKATSESFSSVSSKSSDDESEQAQPKPKAKGKSKAKAKADSGKKAKEAVKAKAKAAAGKVKATKDALRKVIAHPDIFEVADAATAPVRDYLRSLSRVEQEAQQSMKTGVDNFSDTLNSIDLKAARDAGKTLEKELKAHGRTPKKAKGGADTE